MTTFGDFWGLIGTKNHGDSGKIVDVIHHLSPKVPIISLRYFTLDVEFLLRYDARLSPNIFVTINGFNHDISTNFF